MSRALLYALTETLARALDCRFQCSSRPTRMWASSGALAGTLGLLLRAIGSSFLAEPLGIIASLSPQILPGERPARIQDAGQLRPTDLDVLAVGAHSRQ